MSAGSGGTRESSGTEAMASPAARDRAAAVPWWVPMSALASFSFLLHLLWEVLQVPLYTDMASMPHWPGVVVCVKATAGDVLIALTAYATVAAFRRTWHWRASRIRVATYLAVGLAITVLLEALNVYVWHRWAYATSMPLVLGIGVTPLLQWSIVPSLALWLTQRHVAGGSRPLGDTPVLPAPSFSPTRNQPCATPADAPQQWPYSSSSLLGHVRRAPSRPPATAPAPPSTARPRRVSRPRTGTPAVCRGWRG